MKLRSHVLPVLSFCLVLSLLLFGNTTEASALGSGLFGVDRGSFGERHVQYENAGQANALMSAQVGSVISFGAYEQDNDTADGKESIEWQVLAREGDRFLVISLRGLDIKAYDTEWNATWETGELRKWLNSDFLNAAFSDEEQAMIPTVTVSADRNPEYGTDPGNGTRDKVFLLSIDEADRYFGGDEARKCLPTAYAVEQGAVTDPEYGALDGKPTCWWWLRTPGSGSDCAAFVSTGGCVGAVGSPVIQDRGAVRPALWIDPAS